MVASSPAVLGRLRGGRVLLAGQVRFKVQSWEYCSLQALLCPSQLPRSSRLTLWAPTLGRAAVWADSCAVQLLTPAWAWALAHAAAASACPAAEVSSVAADRIRPP